MVEKLYIIADKLLMDEWDYEANQALDPKILTRGSNKKASWKCSKCFHKWKTSIYHRAIKETGCPNCHYAIRIKYASNKILVNTIPEIAKNWHPIKYG